MLPLHLAAKYRASDEALMLALLAAYPEAAEIADQVRVLMMQMGEESVVGWASGVGEW